MSRKFIAVALMLAFVASVRAEEAKPDASEASKVIDVTDLDAIKEAVGKEVTVKGKVSQTFSPSSGSVLLINFEGIDKNDFKLAVRKPNLEAVNGGFDGDVAAAVKDQTILATGKIQLFKEKPQIDISKPDQIKIETKEEEKKPEDEKKPEEGK